MKRAICPLLIAFILVLSFVITLPAGMLSPLYYAAQADSSESWVLKNGTLLTTTHAMNAVIKPNSLQNMVIKISGGIVSSSFPIPIYYENKGSTFTGTVTYTLQGSYSASSGMTGTYTCSIDGTGNSKDGSEKFTLALTGPFSGPGGLAAGKTVTVSFAEAVGPPIPGCEEGGNTKLEPFSVSYTVEKPSVIPSLPASTPIKPSACKPPWLRK